MKTFYFVDDQFEIQNITHTRKIVRAILFNSKNEIALIKIKGDDIFGHRDYYETPGGGVNKNETRLNALRRELLEEVGVEIKNIKFIARVIDYYNLINRRNDNYYYLCEVSEYKEKHLEEYEKTIMEKVEWINITEAYHLFNSVKNTPIANLVKQRELPIIEIATKLFHKVK